MSDFIPLTVCGIPALARVDYFEEVTGSFSRDAPSDLDYYGYVECEFTICDRCGREAPWLDKKLSNPERRELESEVIARIRERIDTGE